MDELKQKFRKIILFLGDIALLYLAFFIVLAIRYGERYNADIFWQHLYPFSIVYIFWIVVFYINNLYSIDQARNSYNFYSLIAKSFFFNSAISILFFYLAFNKIGISPKTILALNILIFAAFFILWRIFYNYFIKSKTFSINTIILSDNDEAKEIIEKIKSHPQLGYNIVPRPLVIPATSSVIPVRQQADETPAEIQTNFNLKNFIVTNNIKLIITSDETKNNPEILRELYESLSLGVRFENLADFYEQITGKIPISIIGQIWFLENIKNIDRPIYDLFKRLMDIILSLALAILAVILSPVIALAIKMQDGGPVFYRQKRAGKDGGEFTLIKFRTMKINAEENGARFADKNDKRITKIGKILRDTRIDELPQIINVIKGEMSFIGPRPERPEFVTDFQKQIPFYNFRHIVRPGLTGWAQVNYDYGSTLQDAYKKLQYELYYIKNKSLILDIDTALKTIKIIISRKGR